MRFKKMLAIVLSVAMAITPVTPAFAESLDGQIKTDRDEDYTNETAYTVKSDETQVALQIKSTLNKSTAVKDLFAEIPDEVIVNDATVTGVAFGTPSSCTIVAGGITLDDIESVDYENIGAATVTWTYSGSAWTDGSSGTDPTEAGITFAGGYTPADGDKFTVAKSTVVAGTKEYLDPAGDEFTESASISDYDADKEYIVSTNNVDVDAEIIDGSNVRFIVEEGATGLDSLAYTVKEIVGGYTANAVAVEFVKTSKTAKNVLDENDTPVVSAVAFFDTDGKEVDLATAERTTNIKTVSCDVVATLSANTLGDIKADTTTKYQVIVTDAAGTQVIADEDYISITAYPAASTALDPSKWAVAVSNATGDISGDSDEFEFVATLPSKKDSPSTTVGNWTFVIDNVVAVTKNNDTNVTAVTVKSVKVVDNKVTVKAVVKYDGSATKAETFKITGYLQYQTENLKNKVTFTASRAIYNNVVLNIPAGTLDALYDSSKYFTDNGETVAADITGGASTQYLDKTALNLKTVSGSSIDLSKVKAPEVDGFTFTGWYAQATKTVRIAGKAVVMKDAKLAATPFNGKVVENTLNLFAGYKPKSFKQTFYLTEKDTTAYKATTVDYGKDAADVVATFDDPKKAGYSFAGWYYYADNDWNKANPINYYGYADLDGNPDVTAIDKDLILYADFTVDGAAEVSKIRSFALDKGSDITVEANPNGLAPAGFQGAAIKYTVKGDIVTPATKNADVTDLFDSGLYAGDITYEWYADDKYETLYGSDPTSVGTYYLLVTLDDTVNSLGKFTAKAKVNVVEPTFGIMIPWDTVYVDYDGSRQDLGDPYTFVSLGGAVLNASADNDISANYTPEIKDDATVTYAGEYTFTADVKVDDKNGVYSDDKKTYTGTVTKKFVVEKAKIDAKANKIKVVRIGTSTADIDLKDIDDTVADLVEIDDNAYIIDAGNETEQLKFVPYLYDESGKTYADDFSDITVTGEYLVGIKVAPVDANDASAVKAAASYEVTNVTPAKINIIGGVEPTPDPTPDPDPATPAKVVATNPKLLTLELVEGKNSVTLFKGAKVQLPAGATTADKKLASVNKKGKVSVKKAGTVTLTSGKSTVDVTIVDVKSAVKKLTAVEGKAKLDLTAFDDVKVNVKKGEAVKPEADGTFVLAPGKYEVYVYGTKFACTVK